MNLKNLTKVLFLGYAEQSKSKLYWVLKHEYNYLFSDTNKQREVLTLFNSLIGYKEKLLKELEDPPGDKLDLSSCTNNCCNSTVFTSCNVCTDSTIIGNK